jgi:hypothetical protein
MASLNQYLRSSTTWSLHDNGTNKREGAMWLIRNILVSVLLLSGIAGAAIAQEPQQNRLARDTDMSVPGAPSQELISDPKSAPVKKVLDWGCCGGESLGPYSCSNGSDGIVCFMLFTRKAGGSGDYNIGNMTGSAHIIDNFHLPHKAIRSYFLDGLGNAQEILNLYQGDTVWWVLVFETGPKPIRGARLVIGAPEFQMAVR